MPDSFNDQYRNGYGGKGVVLTARLATLVVLAVLMMLHLHSVRAFRWEQSVSGGLVVTYCIALLGLTLCAGMDKGCSDGITFEVYICGVGAALLGLNAVVMMIRWRRASDLTRAVAELLESLGVRLTMHVTLKVALSALAAAGMLLDVLLLTFLN